MVGKKKFLWIADELRRLIFKRDYLKKKATTSGDPNVWHYYKQFRNHTNNEIKRAKRLYFANNLDLDKHNMKKTWNLINELNSRNYRNTTNIKEVKIGNQVLNSPSQIAEAFNAYFSNVGSNLADEIPSNSDFNPVNYLNPTDQTFSLQFPTVEDVKRYLKTIDEKKLVGLDKIPNKLLKIAADICSTFAN